MRSCRVASHKTNIIVLVQAFEEWLNTLTDDVHDEIMALIGVLKIYGVTTQYPYSSKVFGSKYKGMRDLRTEIEKRAYRVLYIYDPERRAVLLPGWDKSGDKRWYERNIPLAEAAYDRFLKEGGLAQCAHIRICLTNCRKRGRSR